MSESRYEHAQICENGHVITSILNIAPERRQRFCSVCGEATITQCPNCGAAIRGAYVVPGVIGGSEYRPPSFCHECGKAYPWTNRAVEAARELAREDEDLTEEEREQLAKSLDELMADTPRTQLAANRFKRLISKAGKGTAQGIRDIMVDIASESAKRAIWGPYVSSRLRPVALAARLPA